MATITELCEQRAEIFAKEKAIIDAAEKDGRDLTAEERAACDAMDNDIEALGKQVADKQSDAQRKERMKQLEADLRQPRNPTERRADPTDFAQVKGADDEEVRSMVERIDQATSLGATRREAFKDILKGYTSSRERDLVRTAARRFISAGQSSLSMKERAALQVDVSASGGTLVMPEEFLARVIIGLDERVYMRQLATIFTLANADSLGVPTLDTDPADADWTTELSTGSEDTSMSTGKRMLTPHPLAKRLKVSDTLLRKAPASEQLVRDRLTFKFGVSEEKAFLTGSGAGQPLGVFTASSQGISTSRDISTDNTSTNVTADGLINAKFNLMSQYLANSSSLRWLFHRTVVRNIRKLKDGNGQYIWQAGLAGTPDTILEVPYFMSEFAPSTLTASQYVGIIGDFSWYWIAEALKFQLKRLDELYAETNQVGFIGRMEVDGMPVLEEAFSRVQLSA